MSNPPLLQEGEISSTSRDMSSLHLKLEEEEEWVGDAGTALIGMVEVWWLGYSAVILEVVDQEMKVGKNS